MTKLIRFYPRFTIKQMNKIRLLAYKWKCSMSEVVRRLVEGA